MNRLNNLMILTFSVLIVGALIVAIPEAAVSIDSPTITVPADPDESVILAAGEPAEEPSEAAETDSWLWSAVGLGSAIVLVLIFALRPRDGSSGST